VQINVKPASQREHLWEGVRFANQRSLWNMAVRVGVEFFADQMHWKKSLLLFILHFLF